MKKPRIDPATDVIDYDGEIFEYIGIDFCHAERISKETFARALDLDIKRVKSSVDCPDSFFTIIQYEFIEYWEPSQLQMIELINIRWKENEEAMKERRRKIIKKYIDPVLEWIKDLTPESRGSKA